MSTTSSENATDNVREEKLSAVDRFPLNYKVLTFFKVFGDNILEFLISTIYSILTFAISFTAITIQESRQWISFNFSIVDVRLHLFVTFLPTIVPDSRLQMSTRLDSSADYRAITARPKTHFSPFKWSRFLTITTMVLMNNLAEQAVGYGVPSTPSLIPKQYFKKKLIMAPLGGGVLSSGDPTRLDGKPKFKYFATGLSVLAAEPDTDNTAFYVQLGNQLILYHLPQQLFESGKANLVTQHFRTMGYVATLIRERPIALPNCAMTSSNSLGDDCKRPIPRRAWRFAFKVEDVVPRNDPNRTDVRYWVSLYTADEDKCYRNWTYSATMKRSFVWVRCHKQSNSLTCDAQDTGKIISGKNWLDVKKHEKDLRTNMATCFVNLLSFISRYRISNEIEVVARVIAAMHIREAADDTFTGGLATTQVRETLCYEYADAVLSYSGPLWLRILLLCTAVFAGLTCCGICGSTDKGRKRIRE